LVNVLPPWITPFQSCTVDAPVVVTDPPFTVELISSSMFPPLVDIVPPVFVTVVPLSVNCPPVASISPVFVAPPLLVWSVIPADPFALIVPEFTSVRLPLPM
jgi:hypothetical protein